MVVYTICRTPPQARYLPRRYALKALAKNGATTLLSEPETLLPGQERLYSYYESSMAAGPHKITTKQRISIANDASTPPIELSNQQDFTVVAPRYKLRHGALHTVYPPQGHTDNVEILPHIVLNDPQ